MEGKSVPVPVASIWSLIYPPSVYESGETSIGLSQREENQIDYFLYDILIIFCCPEILSAQINLMWDLFQILHRSGHQRDQISADAYPGDCVLGFSYFISKMTISLPLENMRKIKQDTVHLLQKPLVSIQKIVTLVGKTTAASQAIRVAPLFHCQFQALINSLVSQVQVKVEIQQVYHQKVALTTEARAELQ